jgi:hypothetical protein
MRKRAHILLRLAVILSTTAPIFRLIGSARANPDRVPAPTAGEQLAAGRRVRQAYAAVSVGSESPGQKEALANRVLAAAEGETADLPAKFAMFQMAADTAAGAGDGSLACGVIDKWSDCFVVDALTLKKEALKTSVSGAKSEEACLGCTAAAIVASDTAVTADRYPVAEELDRDAAAAAGRSGNGMAVKAAADQAARVRSISTAFGATKAARAKLAADPADPAAAERVGAFDCFVKGDWQAGLPLLAGGSDKMLAALAEEDLRAGKVDDDAAIAGPLAEKWWAAGQKAPAAQRRAMQWRAVRYCREVVEKSKGLDADLAAEHIRTMRAEIPERVVVDGFTIEADIDGGSELHIMPYGIYWKQLGSYGAEKPGRSNGTNLPTYLDGAAWMPSWGKPKETRSDDRTGVLFMPIGRADMEFTLLAVGGNSKVKDPGTITGIERRDPVTSATRDGEQVVSIPDTQGGDKWYRIRFSRR